MYGQYLRDMPDTTDVVGTLEWLRKADLKVQTEALLCAAKEQAIRNNSVKHHIDKTAESFLCRLCSEKAENVDHVVSECKNLALKKYKRKHDNVAKAVHWKLCEKYGLEQSEKFFWG